MKTSGTNQGLGMAGFEDATRDQSRPRSESSVVPAFTLIELLVVIAILAALLLTTLTKSKAEAMGAICLSNQKQLALAWMQYANDNHDYLILAEWMGPTEEGLEQSWLNPQGPNEQTEAATNTTAQQVTFLQGEYKDGGFWPYAPNFQIIHCPADLRQYSSWLGSTTSSPGQFDWLSYRVADGLNAPLSEYPSFNIFKLPEILHPSARYVFVEINNPIGDGGRQWSLKWPFWEDSWPLTAPAPWHVGSGTFSWADGHAETHRWLDPLMQTFASSMNPTKEDVSLPADVATTPTLAQCPHDMRFLIDGATSTFNP